jgi:hypothetical protein
VIITMGSRPCPVATWCDECGKPLQRGWLVRPTCGLHETEWMCPACWWRRALDDLNTTRTGRSETAAHGGDRLNPLWAPGSRLPDRARHSLPPAVHERGPVEQPADSRSPLHRAPADESLAASLSRSRRSGQQHEHAVWAGSTVLPGAVVGAVRNRGPLPHGRQVAADTAADVVGEQADAWRAHGTRARQAQQGGTDRNGSAGSEF